MQTIEVGVVSIPVVVIYTKMFVAALFCALWEQEKKAFFLLQLRIDSICSFTCRQVGLLPDLSHQPSDCRVVHPICSLMWTWDSKNCTSLDPDQDQNSSRVLVQLCTQNPTYYIKKKLRSHSWNHFVGYLTSNDQSSRIVCRPGG